MIQIMLLDTDDNLLIFSRSDNKEYKRVREYMQEFKGYIKNNNVRYYSTPFKKLIDVIKEK